jgi:hypothetical protein
MRMKATSQEVRVAIRTRQGIGDKSWTRNLVAIGARTIATRVDNAAEPYGRDLLEIGARMKVIGMRAENVSEKVKVIGTRVDTTVESFKTGRLEIGMRV